jgi:hypothetical protein
MLWGGRGLFGILVEGEFLFLLFFDVLGDLMEEFWGRFCGAHEMGMVYE